MIHKDAVYYSQVDPRWKNHPYPSPTLPNATVGSGGCGPTSAAAMVISTIEQIIFPDGMADWSRANGFRVEGGTADGLFEAVAKNWNIEFARPKSTFEMADYCRNNWCVAVKVGKGQFTTGGHFIAVMGINDNNEFQIFDPYLYNGKFEQYGRAGKGRLEGTTYWMEVQKFKDYANAKAFFAFKYKKDQTVETMYKLGQRVLFSSHYDQPNDPVEKAHYDNPYVEGTIIWIEPFSQNQYMVDTGSFQCWINNGDVRSLAGQPPAPQFQPYRVVITANPSLIIRQNPTQNSNRLGSLSKGAIVTILEENNGWGRVDSGNIKGWVSLQYVKRTSEQVKTTVGQKKRFKATTQIRQNPNMTGAIYTYKPNTSVIIKENLGNIDKVETVVGKRVGYVYNNVYK